MVKESLITAVSHYLWEQCYETYIKIATEQKEIDDAELQKRIDNGELIEMSSVWHLPIVDDKEELIDKACSVYENELRQFKCLLNKVKEGAGELIDIDGSVDAFRKAMMEE